MYRRKNGETPSREAIDWVVAHVDLRPSNAAEFWYERMASQSGECLPVIYLPFDGHQRGHFVDRGQILDYATVAGKGRVLDFGPGDGWPSLLLAPMVDEVVGVDGSRHRIDVCQDNAKRLGLSNTRFVHVSPNELLPFEDQSFDGITAASSVEQTADPEATLQEFQRVLKPGGRLRMHYESLSYYQGGHEQEIALGDHKERPSRLLIFDRHVAEEYVRHYYLLLDLSRRELEDVFCQEGMEPSYDGLMSSVLSELCAHLVEAATWTTRHPFCRTWCRWLGEAGFHSASPTYDGGWFAKRLFDYLPASRRPVGTAEVDALLRPLVEVVVGMEASSAAKAGEWEPWITAVK